MTSELTMRFSHLKYSQIYYVKQIEAYLLMWIMNLVVNMK